MTPPLSSLIRLFGLCLCAAAAADEPRPIRVLFLGHESEHHNSGKYLPYLMEAFGREAIYFDYFVQPDCLNAATLARYDAVMLYANHETLEPAGFEALNAFVESGHGFLPIHSASACFRNDPRFAALVGGRFQSHGTGVFKAVTVDRAHPIMQGVNEFESWDETYVHDQPNPSGRTTLAERLDGPHREPWTWVRQHGNGRVFYTASGHDDRTWRNPDFQKLLRNAIVWAVGDSVKSQWEQFLAQREPERREPNPNVANYERRTEALTFQLPMSVKGTAERTQVPADLKLELFAADPDIRKPIALAWDARGRCWVCETSDYPHEVRADGAGNDSIRICEDTDGDGRADKFTVFADQLNIPTGMVFANGGVIVSQPPRFLFLKDTDGDDKADVREQLMTGWGIGDTHAQANNLHYGQDNWIHGCVGYSGFQGSVEGVDKRFAQGTFRFRPDGTGLEFLHQFTNNSWGQSQNEAGDDFGGTANGAPIFYGGIPATAFPVGVRGETARRINRVPEAHAITPNFRQVDVFGGYTAAAGSAFIRSANLPPRLQGMAMVCEPTMKLIALMDVRPDGAGYEARDGFNLVASSDEWMSPVFAEVGPDGAVWFADFQNFIIQHNPTPSVQRGGYDARTGVGGAHENPLRDHSRGRIYRVVWSEAKPPPIKSLQGASTAALVEALGSDNRFWRLTSQQQLVESRAVGAADALATVVAANDGRIAAVHALWTLDGIGRLDEATRRAALLARDSRLRRNAIRTLGSDPASQALVFGSGVISDPDLVTRLAAWIKLSEFPTTPEIKTLVTRMGLDPAALKDPWLAEAIRLLSKRHGVNPFTEGPNLLPNPGLEAAGPDGLPDAWKRRDYGTPRANRGVTWELTTEQPHSGSRAVRVTSTASRADTSLFADVTLKPNTHYKLSAWVRAEGLRGKVSMNDHLNRFETEAVTRPTGWREIEVVYNSGTAPRASLNILFVGEGTAWYDDVKFCELIPAPVVDETALAGDPARGEQIFWKHPVAACTNCHILNGKGSPVGPALDGIAGRKDEAYLSESLLDPNARLADGYLLTPVSPMPPLNLLLKPQELADVKAFILTLK